MTIRFRLLMLVSFFALLIITSSSITITTLGGMESSGKDINVAGRQRMLTQKMTKEFFLQMEHGNETAGFQKTRNLFESSLRELEQKFEGNKDKTQQIAVIKKEWKKYTDQLKNLNENSTDHDFHLLSEQSVKVLNESNTLVMKLQDTLDDGVGLLYTLQIIFALISVVTAGCAYWFLDRFVIRRIENVRRTSEIIAAEKDLTKRIDQDLSDELSMTASSFNKMIDSFANVNRDMQNVEKELQDGLELLSITTQENRNSMDLQRNEIIQVSTAVNQMASTVQEVARNTQSASEISKQAQDEAAHGNELLDLSIQLTHTLASEIRSASENIERLAQASDSIGGIADTISTIAEQTNLLALNAAIEAARAGEQGRGFAVVADEVRTLAQRTQEATSEIHKLITTLQETTHSSVETMENSRKRSDQGVEHAESMSKSLKGIIDSVRSLGDINHQIAVAAEQQSHVAEEVNNSVLSIEAKAENTFANADAAATSTENLAVMAADLRDRLQEYRI